MSFGEVNSMLEGAKAYNRAVLALSANYGYQQDQAAIAQRAVAMQQTQSFALLQQAQSNAFHNYQNTYRAPEKTKLESWWDKLQARGAELGEYDMNYSEWSQWMAELDEFREAAHG